MSENNVSPSVGKRIGEFLILVIYLIVDVESVWPRYRLLSLLTVIFGILALLLLDGGISKKCIIYIMSALSIACMTIYYFAPPILPEETEIHGWLLPANGPTPPNGCIHVGVPPVPPDALLFVAGTNAVWTTAQGKSLVLSVGNSDLLFVERDRTQLMFDADIYDENGNLAVRVTKNEFHLVAGEYSYQERTDDRSKIAVYDKTGKEMLYIDYVNPNTILIRGLFVSQDGTKVKIDNDNITIIDVNNVYARICKAGFGGNNAGYKLSRNKSLF